MRALNNKLIIEVLPESEQYEKDIFSRGGNVLRKCKVIDAGDKVVNVKVGDIISLYFHDILHYENHSYCGENNVLFINDIPPDNRVHLIKTKSGLSTLQEARVISTMDENLKKDDVVLYNDRTGLTLPDGSTIVGNSQVYSKIN